MALGRYRVLLIDPVRMRREKAVRVLGMRFDVAEAYTPAEARDAIKKAPPDAIVATLRQVEENGLLMAKALRELVPDAFILVHGSTTSMTTAAERRHVLERHGVDQWAPTNLEPDDLAIIIHSKAMVQRIQKAPRVSVWKRLRGVTRKDVWEFFTRHHHILPNPPPNPENPHWFEILNGPPTFSNVRRLMTKPLF
jgi:DNA-binding NarL/FixJ family response regulator